MRIRSPSKAPPENGDEGSTARMPTRLPRARKAPTTALVNVNLPTPGLPVTPRMCARPVCGARADITSRSAAWPSSTIEISRATARGAPALAASTRAGTSTDLLAIMETSGSESTSESTSEMGICVGVITGKSLPGNAHDQCVPLPAATAESGHTHAAAATLELQDEVQGYTGPRHADGVPDGDRASVDVDLVCVDPKNFGGCQPHRGEGLVDLDQVEIGGADALLRTGPHDGMRGLTLQRGVRAGGDAMGADLGEPGQAQLFGLGLAHHHDGGSAIGDRRRGPGRDSAVLAEGGTKLAKTLYSRVRTDALVDLQLNRVALALRNRHRDDLVVEQPVLPGARGALVAARRELILLGAGEVHGANVAVVRQQTHRLVRERVPQAVKGHVIAHRDITELEAIAALLQQVWSVGHRLLATSHDDLELTRPNQLVGQGDRVNPREAHLVDAQRWDAHRDAGLDSGLTCGDLTGAGGQYLAHDHVLHLVASHAGLLQGTLDGHATEVRPGEVLQGAEQATQRGARSGDDHRCGTFAHRSTSNDKGSVGQTLPDKLLHGHPSRAARPVNRGERHPQPRLNRPRARSSSRLG